MSAPAGWHPDPSNPNQQRWWNGQIWTDSTQAVPSPSSILPAPHQPNGTLAAVTVAANYMPSMIAALAASVGIVIGSIGPWLTFMAFSQNGVEGDGVITLVLGAVSAIVMFTLLGRRSKAGFVHRWASTAAGVVCLVIAIVDIMDVTSRTAEFFGKAVGAQVGWGLWMVAICAAVLCLTASTVAKQLKKR